MTTHDAGTCPFCNAPVEVTHDHYGHADASCKCAHGRADDVLYLGPYTALILTPDPRLVDEDALWNERLENA